jgi:hypothetical protein
MKKLITIAAIALACAGCATTYTATGSNSASIYGQLEANIDFSNEPSGTCRYDVATMVRRGLNKVYDWPPPGKCKKAWEIHAFNEHLIEMVPNMWQERPDLSLELMKQEGWLWEAKALYHGLGPGLWD